MNIPVEFEPDACYEIDHGAGIERQRLARVG
jgi:hypothetical protein